jgi:hypothetical protein
MIQDVELDGLVLDWSFETEEEPLCITSCVKVVLKHEVVLIGGDLESGEEVA